jgi:L,D-transpeptidase-like protein
MKLPNLQAGGHWFEPSTAHLQLAFTHRACRFCTQRYCRRVKLKRRRSAFSFRPLLIPSVALLAGGALSFVTPSSAMCAPPCHGGGATETSIGAPNAELGWRAAPIGRAEVYRGIPGAGGKRVSAIDTGTADWLLVLRSVTTRQGHCWVKLRLPGRPNNAAGWVRARRLLLRPTPWRLAVSLGARTLTLYRAGSAQRVFPAVVGAPSTPTPRGLFSIVHAWRSNPRAFVGSWILGLTAHSNVLRHFEGGNGEIGIHGRGGASLLDPLGSAASHGCIRLANRAIDDLVRVIGQGGLPGIPVRVSG